MHEQDTDRKAATLPQGPETPEAVKTKEQKAECAEVIGRHKNSGQKDHKGAR